MSAEDPLHPDPLEQAPPAEGFFTISTGRWLPIQPLFGAKIHLIPTDTQKGTVEVREYLRVQSASSDFRVRTHFEGDTGTEAQRFEQQMLKALSPAGLKIVMGLFRAAHDQGRSGYFTLDTNHFLDSLGYQRSAKGYHTTTSIRQLYQTIDVLKKIRLVGYIRRQLPSGKDEVLLAEEQFIIQWGEHQVWHTPRGKPPGDQGENVRSGVTLQINPKIYADIAEKNLFSWVDRAYLTLDANRHPYVIQLMPFYTDPT